MQFIHHKQWKLSAILRVYWPATHIHTARVAKDKMEGKCMQPDSCASVYTGFSPPLVASKLVNLTLKHHGAVAAWQSSRVHWCEHLSPTWTLAQMWHTGSGHMQAFHPSSSLLLLLPCNPPSNPQPAHTGVVRTRVTTVGCGDTLTHITPHKRSGPSSFSPGQARLPLRKALIDLMDLRAVHTPSPNKQSAQDLSPLRQRGSARLSLACKKREKKTLGDRLRG